MKKIIFFLSLSILVLTTKAQISGSFAIGGVAIDAVSSFSGPIAFDGKNDCMTLQNGVSVLMSIENKGGNFKMVCREIGSSKVAAISVFPNPSSSFTMLQSDEFASANQLVELVLMDARGKVVHQQQCRGEQLRSGMQLPVSQLTGGLYLLRVSSGQTSQTFKIIKTGTLK
jgi:hypothetical protein